MARSMWTGAISFGLVNIPVRMFSAVRPQDVHFHMLHDADGVRIKQKRVCPADGEEVDWNHIVKGYEIAKDQYVRIEPEELNALNPKATHAIDIESFVDLEEIDPIFYENSYYLAPDRGAQKPYALLLQALERTNKVAIARVVLRTKQYLCALRATGDVLTMSTMFYHDEIVAHDDIEGLPTRSETRLHEKELAMAEQLIESLTTKFEPSEYEDEHREKVLELIERKAEGEEIETQPDVEPRAQVVDLVSALKASLAHAKKHGDLDVEAEAAAEGDGEEAEEAAPARTTHRTRKAASGTRRSSNGSRAGQHKKAAASARSHHRTTRKKSA